MTKGFTLIELLVVVAVVTLLLGVLLPVTGQARLQAKVLTVNAELRDIGLALDAYSFDYEGRYPPTRVDCMIGGHFYQLPCELVECGYLPAPPSDSFMAAGIEDRFNAGYTYKYRSVGTLIYNRTTVVEEGACLWVPWLSSMSWWVWRSLDLCGPKWRSSRSWLACWLCPFCTWEFGAIQGSQS